MLHNTMIDENRLQLLLKLTQQGDKSSYREFLSLILPLVNQRCKKCVFKSDQVDDLVQETLMAVHKGLATFDGSRPVLPWLYAIINHKTIDYLRKMARNREDAYGEALDHMAEITPDVTNDDDEANELLKELPESLRQPLILTKVEGYSTMEAAKMLGIKENALRTRISRAYEKLKEILETKGEYHEK